MKTLEAVGMIYKGVAILETMECFVIFGEDGKRFEFASQTEAKLFVDAWTLASQRVMSVGEVPTQ